MRAGNGVARNRFRLGVDVRGVEALGVQAEMRFRISSRGPFEQRRVEETCVSRWVREFICAIRCLVNPV